MVQNPIKQIISRPFSRIDWVLFLSLSLLIVISFFTLYSASGESQQMLQRQALHFLAAFVLMVFVSQLSSSFLEKAALWVYGAGILLLVLVLVAGTTGGGATRWLDLGIIRFQPSEMMKLAVPLMIARYFSDRVLPPRFIDIVLASVMVVIPVLLIAKQPDLGTSLLVASAGFFVIFFAGISWKWIVSIVVAAVIAAPLLFFYGMHEYQRQRVMTLFDPTSDRLGSGYHILQSMIAIGSGGTEGKGWLDGDQSRLDFLPERHTDFIFAVFGEEFGFYGNLTLLFLYFFIIARSLYLALQGTDTFSRLLGGALAMTFFIYLFVNTGMVSGILPVVGVPLPMVSYGGTSLVTLMAGFGLIMGLRERKRRY